MKKYAWCLIVLCLPACLPVQAQLKVSSGASVTLSGAVGVTVQDLDVLSEGTVTAGSASFIRLTGSQPKELSAASPLALSTLIVDKAGAGKVTLGQHLEITGGVQLVSGLLELNGYTITLEPGAALSGESASGRITGVAGGYVETTVDLNAPVEINPGNLGAVISSEADMGSTTVRRGHVAQVTGSFAGINRYFDILPENNSGLGATLRFLYLEPELNGTDDAGLVLARSTDHTSWTDESAGTTADPAGNYLEKQGVGQFSRWTAFGEGTLPVRLVYFLGSIRDSGEGDLAWATAFESGFSHFEVQGSPDGKQFSPLGTVSAGVAAAEQVSYRFTDRRRPAGLQYYRLKIADLDGSYAYSPLVSLDYGNNRAVSAYPNPVHAALTLKSGQAVETVEVFDGQGVLLDSISGSALTTVPMAAYPAGIYLIRINSSDLVRVIKE